MKGAAFLLLAIALTTTPTIWAHRLVTPVSTASSLTDNAQTCDACIVVGRVLSDYLCDFDFVGGLVQSVAEVVCKGAEDEQCDQTVSVLLPLAVEYARTTATPDALCFYAGLCNSGSAAASAHPAAALLHMHANRAGCAECRYVAAAIRAAQSSGSADVAAKQACSALPRELAASCNTLTEDAGLMQRFAAFDRACELSGPCAWSALDAMFGGLQGTPAPALQHLGQVLRSAQRQQPLVSLPTDASTCDKCKLTVLEVRMLVHSVTVQQEIVNITRLVCDHLAPYEELCRSTIDTYAPAAFGLVDKYLQPDTVCGNLLQLCPIKQRQQVRLVAAQRHGSIWQTMLGKLQELWQTPPKAEVV